MMFYGNGMGGWWGYALMTIGMLVFWAILIFGVVYLVRATTNSAPPQDLRGPVGPNPEALLAERFARGEIDHEQYLHSLQVLRTHQQSP